MPNKKNEKTQKIADALQILVDLDVPKAQQNDRTALCLLALLDVKPDTNWEESQTPLVGITPMMEYAKKHYNKEYAPNTRETFRRFSMHQLVEAGIALYNPDKPDRPVNSPHAVYQISTTAFFIIKHFGTGAYLPLLEKFKSEAISLAARYQQERKMAMIPVTINSNTKLGLTADEHGKMPDVIFYAEDKKWLVLVESVTSHGPVDSKRKIELQKLFPTKLTTIYVSAFPNKQTFTHFASEISWETEAWIADNPTHMIHFNGDKFLG
jgi:hypothetical protein